MSAVVIVIQLKMINKNFLVDISNFKFNKFFYFKNCILDF